MNRILQSIAVAITILLLTMPAVLRPSEMQTQETVEQTAKIVLNAPSSARVGELVRLDASASSADSFKWVLVPESVDFEVYAEGKKAIFSAREKGTYLFIVAAARGGSVDIKTIKIEIKGPPSEPEDVSDVRGHVKFWLEQNPVSDASRHKLADAFTRIAEMGLGEPEAWIYETKRAVDEALGDDKPKWEPFLRNLGKYMGQLGADGVMTDAEGHKRVWLDIAAALREGA